MGRKEGERRRERDKGGMGEWESERVGWRWGGRERGERDERERMEVHYFDL